mgnify:CR=1 FL=1|tara:strand:+ start:372 stop:1181 length:810 start_codon:yes stop_codon:yes gene_type:complete
MIWPFKRKSKKRIARIVIEEPITSSTRIATLKALKQVEDREFPALIMRIDSPGGTVGDSQEIYSAINRIKSKGCKVIASFGNISASGGVYIGVAADKIVANPGTITGSIGVIIRGNNFSDLLDKIGIKFETVKSGLFKDILSPDKPLSDEGRALLQGLIDESYKQFTEAVSESRNIPVEDVRKFADGRIFTGSQAKELGLVDEIGDEYKAREIASEMTNTDLKIEPVTIGKKKKKILGLIPGSEFTKRLINLITFEIESANKLLWLYKP